MILKDFQCRGCNAIQECTVDVNESTVHLFCPRCDSESEHDSLCNGGTNSRYRFADFPDDPAFWRGQVKASASQACTSQNEIVNHKDGGPIEARLSSDRRAENREKLYHKNDTKRGKTPLYFHK